jgi:hypothetical protein
VAWLYDDFEGGGDPPSTVPWSDLYGQTSINSTSASIAGVGGAEVDATIKDSDSENAGAGRSSGHCAVDNSGGSTTTEVHPISMSREWSALDWSQLKAVKVARAKSTQ